MAVDPDVAPDDAESWEDSKALEPGGPPDWCLDDFEPFKPDVAEAASIGA